jgi:hypothetical protein
MWNTIYTITPVVIVATRIITECLKKNSGVIPEKHSTDSLQKTWNITHNMESIEV